MPRSIRVHPDLVLRVKSSVKHNGFLRQKDLVEAVGLADSTVRNFLNGKPVDYATFVEICQKLNLEWQDFADLGEDATPPNKSREVVDTSASNLSPEQKVLNQSQSSTGLPDQEKNTPDASYLIAANSFLEYFAKAIEQLGSKHIHVRIGAISSLGKLAEFSR